MMIHETADERAPLSWRLGQRVSTLLTLTYVFSYGRIICVAKKMS